MFGKYKQSITNVLVSSYANKKLFKESFHGLMKGLRENKIAREFLVLYGEVENKRFDDKELAEEYLNEVIKTLKSKKKNLRTPILKEQVPQIIKEVVNATNVCVIGSKSEGAGAGKWISVDGDDQRAKVKGVKVGTSVTIDGDKTKVSKIWTDDKKRPAAFQFENGKVVGFDLCFTVSAQDAFINKTANYKGINYTFEDLKSGAATAIIGDKGEAIKQLQTLVGAKPDGYFGPLTLAKVKEYQESKGAPVTGIVDSKTFGVGTQNQEIEQEIGKICIQGGKGSGNFEFGVKKDKDREKLKAVKVGDAVTLANDDTKKAYVSKIWTDSKGRPGAFKFKQTNAATVVASAVAGETLCFAKSTDIQLENYNKIYSQLDSLIFNDSVRSIEKNLRNKRSLIEHLTREEKVSKMNGLVTNSIFSSLATKKFNEKYSSLNEDDKTTLKKLLSLDKNQLETQIVDLKESALDKLKTLKETSEDNTMKNKIQEVCESISNSDINAASILKIENLNKSLIK